jgi:preprotein translocase subunit SecA
LWADYLAAVSELRSGIQWVSWGGRDPLHEYLKQVDGMFRDMIDSLEEETALRMEQKIDPAQRGATWTYLTTDNPFGSWTERIVKGVIRKACR